MTRFRIVFCMLTLAAAAHAEHLKWHAWSPAIFEQAKKEQRFVLLDLEAVWCHWCHVMEETTYADAKVQQLLSEKYLCVRVDQDARPDLSNRYEDYGWPATVIFAADGSEIVKRRGYIAPAQMISLLEAVIADPTPGPSVEPPRQLTFRAEGSLGIETRTDLLKRLADGYDDKEGGWGFGHKYLDWDNVEWSLRRGFSGDAEAEKRARQTIHAQRALLDPVWGGMYQYSTDGDWVHPHFEKIMSVQAENLRIASLAYAQWGDPADLATARAIERYLTTFWLDPDGAYYTSQDADLVPGEHSAEYFALSDTDRRAKGIPRIDRNIYSRENGWLITGLVALHAATGDPAPLSAAIRAAQWIIAHRAMESGGFRHGEKDTAVYLGDQIAMIRAFLALHSATADAAWLQRAEGTMAFIGPRFIHTAAPTAGFTTADAAVPPYLQVDENIAVARAANELYHRTGATTWRELSTRAMRYIATPEVLEDRRSLVGGALLANEEVASPPLHLTIVGPREDAAARALFAAALHAPHTYRRLDWFDPAGPKPRNLELEFPKLPHAAAFICGESSCSAPVREPDALTRTVKKQAQSAAASLAP